MKLTAVVVIAVALVACGDDDDSDVASGDVCAVVADKYSDLPYPGYTKEHPLTYRNLRAWASGLSAVYEAIRQHGDDQVRPDAELLATQYRTAADAIPATDDEYKTADWLYDLIGSTDPDADRALPRVEAWLAAECPTLPVSEWVPQSPEFAR